MAFYSGNGGKATVGAGADLNIGDYELDVESREVENTHSGSAGSTNFEHVVFHAEGNIEIPVDSTSLPEAGMGFTRGAKITLKLYLGATGKFHTLTNTLVKKVGWKNSQKDDIGRVRVEFKGGAYTTPT
jgi:hypothetical protein